MQTVAVVTPIYATNQNGRLLLMEQTLQSVAKQEISAQTNLVHIVVDDGSPEDVETSIKEFAKRSKLKPRYVQRTRNPDDIHTSANALNLGFDLVARASQDVFTKEEAQSLVATCYLHSDDLFTRSSVQTRLEMLRDTFTYGDLLVFLKNGRLARSREKKGSLQPSTEYVLRSHGIDFPHHTTMWNIEFLKKLREYIGKNYCQNGLFDTTTQNEDRDATISSAKLASALQKPIIYVGQPAIFYREHNQSITYGRFQEIADYEDRQLCKKHFEIECNVHGRRKSLFENLPWSLFRILPESIKKDLRPMLEPVRDYFTGANKERREFEAELEQILAT